MEFRGVTQCASAIVILLYFQTCCCAYLTSCTLGECVEVMSCEILRTLNQSTENIITIKQHLCGDRKVRSICCTDLELDLFRKSNLLDDADVNNKAAIIIQLSKQCASIDKAKSRRLNGVKAAMDEFPWMALLEFENNVNGERKVLCAGTLISDQYVLTAAHCFMKKNVSLATVRLGEYDTKSDPDCTSKRCALPVQNIGIEEVIIHNGNRLVFDDIALIRLKDKAVYGFRVGPLCLPILKDYTTDVILATVAGWGYTASGNNSDVLQKADVPVLSYEACRNKFPLMFPSSLMCAGGTLGRDTCRGDSGGPLFTRGGRDFNRYIQYGILSAGGEVCGGNNTVPSIYTKVSDYVPWIIKNMKP